MEPQKTPSSITLLPLLGLSRPSIEDSVGLFLSAFLLLGLMKALGWIGRCEPAYSLRSHLVLPRQPLTPLPSIFPIVAYLTIPEDSKEKAAAASLNSKVTVPIPGSFPPPAVLYSAVGMGRWLLAWQATAGVGVTQSFVLTVAHLRLSNLGLVSLGAVQSVRDVTHTQKLE